MTEEFKLTFSLKGKRGKMNISRANTVQHDLINGSHVIHDERSVGAGDTLTEAALEYLADSLGVVGQIEHNDRKRLLTEGGGYRL